MPNMSADPTFQPEQPAAEPSHGQDQPTAFVEPIRLKPLLPRRQNPWLLVEVDGASGHGALVWALREAARRDATVVAVSVVEPADEEPLTAGSRRYVHEQMSAHDRLAAQVLRAIAETGVHGRTRTAVLDRAVFDALAAASRGADLVLVARQGKTLLRHAVPRPPAPRLVRGA
jgi:D-arabinose 1-dehydrogenase-like Zn-dependent alcohol dehydrogenase